MFSVLAKVRSGVCLLKKEVPDLTWPSSLNHNKWHMSSEMLKWMVYLFSFIRNYCSSHHSSTYHTTSIYLQRHGKENSGLNCLSQTKVRASDVLSLQRSWIQCHSGPKYSPTQHIPPSFQRIVDTSIKSAVEMLFSSDFIFVSAILSTLCSAPGPFPTMSVSLWECTGRLSYDWPHEFKSDELQALPASRWQGRVFSGLLQSHEEANSVVERFTCRRESHRNKLSERSKSPPQKTNCVYEISHDYNNAGSQKNERKTNKWNKDWKHNQHNPLPVQFHNCFAFAVSNRFVYMISY